MVNGGGGETKLVQKVTISHTGVRCQILFYIKQLQYVGEAQLHSKYTFFGDFSYM